MSYVTVQVKVDDKKIIVGATPELLQKTWNIYDAERANETLARIGKVIVANHSNKKPLRSEYLLTHEVDDRSLDMMLDWLL